MYQIPENPLPTDGQKTERLFWSKNATKLIGKFLSGTVELPKDSEKDLWRNLNLSTNFGDQELPLLIQTANELLSKMSQPTSPSELDQPQESRTYPFDSEVEYQFFAKKSSQVLIQVVIDSLRKFGIWEPDESRNISAWGGLRGGEKKNFSQSEIIDVESKGLLTY